MTRLVHVVFPGCCFAKFPKLPDFLIDRQEVSNAEFKKFVDDEGYTNPEFWEHTLGSDWKQVVQKFTTADGQTLGPRFWSSDSYDERFRDHPVVGVSWYEAMAYARWSEKQLPTLYHWLCSADFDGLISDFDPEQRFNIGERLLTQRSVNDGVRSSNYYGLSRYARERKGMVLKRRARRQILCNGRLLAR